MKKLNTIILSIMILIEPFLDTYFIYNQPGLELFGFRISTIIRYGLLAVICVLLLIETKYKKNRKSLIIYCVLIVIYLFIHHYNALSFHSLMPNNFSYSLKEELFYIARYLFPLIIVYDINSIKITKKQFKNIVIALSLIISISVIISNIFYLSKSSYYEYNISYNIFDWFTKEISYANASTRGFFYATIVMTSLFLITPYIYSLYYQEGKYLYLTTIICNMLALFMAGTKACTLGFVIVAIIMPLMYLFFVLIKKDIKINAGRFIATITIVVICLSTLTKTPAMQRVYLTNEMYANVSDKKGNDEKKPIKNNNDDEEDNTITSIEDLENVDISQYKDFNEIYYIENKVEREKAIKKYIQVNAEKVGITTNLFIVYYPYLYDYNFWADIILNENEKMKADNRFIQTSIFDRIKDINNSKLDDYVGITYSRTSKIFNLERDFLYQYYSLGIIGVILFLFPLVGMLALCIIKVLTNKKLFNIENCSLILGIGLFLCIAFYSGNMLDNLGLTIILGYVLGYLLQNVLTKEKESNN